MCVLPFLLKAWTGISPERERERERERNVFIFKIIDITYNINVTLHWYTLIYKKKEKK